MPDSYENLTQRMFANFRVTRLLKGDSIWKSNLLLPEGPRFYTLTGVEFSPRIIFITAFSGGDPGLVQLHVLTDPARGPAQLPVLPDLTSGLHVPLVFQRSGPGLPESVIDPIDEARSRRRLTEAMNSQAGIAAGDLSDEEYEELTRRTSQILAAGELARERMKKDQQEIEQLKLETRAMLIRLRAA